MKPLKRLNNPFWSIVDSFDDVFENPFWTSKIVREQVIRRGLEVYSVETNNEGMLLKIDVPGIKLDDIDITIVNRTVTVTTLEKSREVVHSYTIDEGFDVTKIGAKLDLGVLTLSCPKIVPAMNEEQPRKITITTK